MRRSLATAIGFAALAVVAAAWAEPPPGAAACSGCHATVSPAPSQAVSSSPSRAAPGVATPVPRLAGLDAAAITAAMRNFRTGARPGTVMDRIARGFTEAEIDAIADWWAARP